MDIPMLKHIHQEQVEPLTKFDCKLGEGFEKSGIDIPKEQCIKWFSTCFLTFHLTVKTLKLPLIMEHCNITMNTMMAHWTLLYQHPNHILKSIKNSIHCNNMLVDTLQKPHDIFCRYCIQNHIIGEFPIENINLSCFN
jgi:hypothetical protein